MTALIVLIVIIVVVAIFVIGIYNRIVNLDQRADQAFADVDVQLKQRQDLVPNLVETVKGYAAHEKQTLENVVAARNSAVNAEGPAAQAQAEGMLTQALGRLFALAEAYPDLKANTNFLELQRELSDIENKIAAARRFFNNSVQEYNTAIMQIPGNFVAPIGNFTQRDFFEIPESSRADLEQAPEVTF